MTESDKTRNKKVLACRSILILASDKINVHVVYYHGQKGAKEAAASVK